MSCIFFKERPKQVAGRRGNNMPDHTTEGHVRNILQALTWLLELHTTPEVPVPRPYLARWEAHLQQVLAALHEEASAGVPTFQLRLPLPWRDR